MVVGKELFFVACFSFELLPNDAFGMFEPSFDIGHSATQE